MVAHLYYISVSSYIFSASSAAELERLLWSGFQSAKGPKYCFWGADCQSNMPLRAGGDCKWLVGMGTMTNEIPGGKSTQQRSGRVVLQLTISFRMLSMPSKYLLLVSPSYNLYLAFQKSGILVLLNKGVLHKNFQLQIDRYWNKLRRYTLL